MVSLLLYSTVARRLPILSGCGCIKLQTCRIRAKKLRLMEVKFHSSTTDISLCPPYADGRYICCCTFCKLYWAALHIVMLYGVHLESEVDVNRKRRLQIILYRAKQHKSEIYIYMWAVAAHYAARLRYVGIICVVLTLCVLGNLMCRRENKFHFRLKEKKLV